MTLGELIDRSAVRSGGKIPWHEPGFSARMLAEHLSDSHDLASRRPVAIDRHVDVIHRAILAGRSTRILDLGCGPGLYCERLARRGHTTVGIDFSPASIEHARAAAEQQGFACEYHHRDLREGGFGSGFGAALLLYGELNTFSAAELQALLSALGEALASGGVLVLEPHVPEFVCDQSQRSPTWSRHQRGLFSASPHIWLRESAWLADERAAVESHYVIAASSADVRSYHSTTWAYTDEEIHCWLRDAGLEPTERLLCLDGSGEGRDGLYVQLAQRK